MCGINAIVALGGARIDREELLRTRDAMSTRGPDASGVWFSPDGTVGLGHRRLSIIDVSERGSQPMLTSDGRFAIAFNGEIYNYRELRAGLEEEGVRFRSDSDTEVLLALFARDGMKMIPVLRGMFAIAIWDSRERTLFLARDPYGIKPLYYARGRDAVRVASQVKALLAGGRVSRAVDPAGLAGFLIRGSVPEPFTTFEEIHNLPAGSHATIDRMGNVAIERYFSIAEAFRDGWRRRHDVKRSEWQELVSEAVAESVRYHLVADVALGGFLSAGKDSSVLMGLAAEAGHRDLTAVTLRFREFEGTAQDEAPLAALAARHYGLRRHVVRTMDRAEFQADLPKLLSAMDQPSIDGFNSWFAAKAAAELGLKVMLSGTGGDELFGGYTTFRKIPRFVRFARGPSKLPGLALGVRRLYDLLHRGTSSRSPKSGSILEYCGTYEGAYLMKRGLFMPEELPRLLPPDLAREGLSRLQIRSLLRRAITPDPGSPFARVAALESSFFLRDQLLRDIDWTSMAHSVEVRTPLVDAHLLRRLAPVVCAARDHDKSLLAHSPSKPLPAELLHRRKTGFLMPMDSWLHPTLPGPRAFGMRAFAVMMLEQLLPAVAA